MSYIITKSDGTTLVTISDGVVDTTTSLNLPGPNFVGYGEKLNENLVYLLENFSANSAPGGVNLQGQLWFDKYHQRLNVFTTQGYRPVSGIINANSEPPGSQDGDVWYNTVTEQAYIRDNNTYKLIGPIYSKQYGVATAVPATMSDAITVGATHDVIQIQVDNVLLAVFSKDKFTPTPAIPGFTTINSGLTLNSNYTPSLNGNITGYLLGDSIGTHYGDVIGNTTGTHIGNVTGNVVGNITGSVTGTITGNINSILASITSLTATSAVISGGSMSGVTSISVGALSATSSTVGTEIATNLISSNVQITGGNVIGLSNLAATNSNITNLVAGNISVTGGNILGVSNVASTSGYFSSLTTGAITVSGGSLTGLTLSAATTGTFTNLNTSNIQATGGNVLNLTTLSGTTANLVNLTSSNLQATGGTVQNITGSAVTLNNSVLNNSTATTQLPATSNTAVATTAFVHSVVPVGVIWMWNSTAVSIPSGWQLCDGSNGTPDLRDRFIVGAGSTYNVAATGGSNSTTLTLSNLPSHAHSASSTFTGTAMGSHSHTITDPGHSHYTGSSDGIGSSRGGGDAGNKEMADDWNAGNGPRVYSNTAYTGVGVANGSAGTPTGSVATTVANAGATSPTAVDSRPPYYALCYIQKMIG